MKKRGFTLIELLASLAIISILVIVGSTLFGTSLKITKNSYDAELDYKEAAYGMLFIENVIRSSYKIEPISPTKETNFKAYVKKSTGEVASYVFKTGPYNTSTYLIADSTNLSKKDSRGGTLYIAKCDSLYLFYNELDNTVKIILNDQSSKNRYESLITLGERL